jgi:Nucleolar protein 12 (25kDa)
MRSLPTDGAISKTNSKASPMNKQNVKGKKKAKGKRDRNDKKIKVLKKGVESIEFDATARYQHLTGFSERKRARRAYGLAQQKMKDRKSILEHRAAIRTAERDFIVEAEKLKQEHSHLQQEQQHGTTIMKFMNPDDDTDDNDSKGSTMNQEEDMNAEETIQVLFDGEETEQKWGGHVIVTTSTHIPGESDDDSIDDDDDDNDNRKNMVKNHDTEQEYAGNIEKYIKSMKGNLPSKKKRTGGIPLAGTTVPSNKKSRTKGQHGATNMKGVGSAADMKVAQKMLSRSTSKSTKRSMSSGGPKGRKSKR